MPKGLRDGTSINAANERNGRGMGLSGVSVRSLEVFVAVAKAGSMSLAAGQLGLTQPAISQSVSALETSLGIQLFDRSVRPPALTLQATGLVHHAAAILESVRKFEGALRLGQNAGVPSLRIGMPNSVATTMGPQIMRRLRDIAAELSVDSGFAATRFQALRNREFDFVVTADESVVPPDLQTMPFLTEPLLIVAPQSYDGDLADIPGICARLDLIRFGRDPNMVNRLDRALHAVGGTPTRRYHLDTNEAVMQMVAAGVGWTILPALAVIMAVKRAETIRVAQFPMESLDRTIMVAMRRGEGLHFAEEMHTAALEVLSENIVPLMRRLLPEIAEKLVLHGSPAQLGRIGSAEVCNRGAPADGAPDEKRI